MILFDPTNPVAVWVDDKVGYIPAFTIIGKEKIEDIEIIEFDFDYLLKIHNCSLHECEVNRQYKTCNFELKKGTNSNKKI